MNNKRNIRGIFFMLLLITIFSSNNSLGIDALDRKENDFIRLDNDLIPSEQIAIAHDSDFIDYGFPGTGSAEDPYRIEKYNITEPNHLGIVILYTTKHFVIRNCYINCDKGILLFLIQAGTAKIKNNILLNSYSSCDSYAITAYKSNSVTIINNTIINSKIGVQVDECKNPVVRGNTHFNTMNVKLEYASGIIIDDCDSASVQYNNCTNVPKGYVISSCNNTVFANNYAHNNSLFGIWNSDSNFTTLNDNICIQSGNYGIILNSTNYSSVNNNTLYLNEYNIYSKLSHYLYASNNTCSSGVFGIKLESTHFSRFYYNSIEENLDYGIYVDVNSKNNTLTHNSFIDNNVGENNSQAYDEGSDNIWYNSTTKEGNYWSDLGKNKTYTIDGPANAFDKYPLNENLERISANYLLFTSFSLIFLAIIYYSRRKNKSNKT
jgi:parallel beta-helix repeat protein